MIVNGGVNPYDSQRFGFGYIDTIQRQRFAASSQNRISASNERDESIQAFKKIMRIREAVQAIKPMMLETEEIQVAGSARATSASSLDLSSSTTEHAHHPGVDRRGQCLDDCLFDGPARMDRRFDRSAHDRRRI